MPLSLIPRRFTAFIAPLPLIFALPAAAAALADELDLKRGYPHAPALAATVNGATRESMAKFSANYPLRSLKPDGKGVPAEEFDREVAAIAALFIDPARPGEPRPIAIDDESAKPQPPPAAAGINADLIPAIARISRLYASASPEQATRLEALYRSLMAQWLKSMPQPGEKIPWMGNGYGWRSRGPGLFALLPTLPPPASDRVCLAIIRISGGDALFQEIPHSSTDFQLNYYPTLFTAAAAIRDPRLKWQTLLAIRRGLDRATLGDRLISPDGGIIHHEGHHTAYASYSFGPMLHLQWVMARAGIFSPDSRRAVERLKLAAEAWAWTTLAGEIPPVFQLRPGPVWNSSPPPGDAAGLTIEFARRIAELDAATRGLPDISTCTDLARLAASKTYGHPDRLPAPWQAGLTPAMQQPLTGHRPFPVMGAAIHRRADWTVVVRGANHSWRGGEVYAGPEYPGAYLDEIMQGALFIFSRGEDGRPPNVVDSGYGAEGYNPNLFPNASAIQLDNVARAGRGNPDYMGSSAPQGGGCDLEGDGMWAWNPPHCRKSAFFFGNRITLVTRELTLRGKVATGLIQTRLAAPLTDPLWIDGATRPATGDWTLPGEIPHTLLDDKGSGYFVPAGNPPLVVHRGPQEWTYVLPARLKPGLDPKAQPPLRNRQDLAAALPNYLPTRADFSTAWFDHGENPSGAACTFTVLVRTTPEELAAFSRSMAGDPPPFTLATSATAHDFLDLASGTRCVATFADDAAFAPGEVLSINRPATLMWRNRDGVLALSLGSTDLKDRRPFLVTLQGRWRLEGEKPQEEVIRVSTDATTRLEIPYRDQTPVKLRLRH